MGEPAVRCRAVPVLDARRDVHHIAGKQLLRGFARLLIIAPARHAHQDLSAALGGMVDVPVVPAARLKRHIENAHLLGGERRQIALPDEVLGKGVVGRADGEHHGIGVYGLGILRRVLRPDLLGHAERRPCLGPPRVERRVGQYLRDLRFRDTVVLRGLQMIPERGVRQPLRHQGHHRHDAAVPQGELVLPAPHLPEQHIVVKLRELRRKRAQGLPARRLFHCHGLVLLIKKFLLRSCLPSAQRQISGPAGRSPAPRRSAPPWRPGSPDTPS